MTAILPLPMDLSSADGLYLGDLEVMSVFYGGQELWTDRNRNIAFPTEVMDRTVNALPTVPYYAFDPSDGSNNSVLTVNTDGTGGTPVANVDVLGRWSPSYSYRSFYNWNSSSSSWFTNTTSVGASRLFAYDPTSNNGARPAYEYFDGRYCLNFDGVTDFMTNNGMSINLNWYHKLTIGAVVYANPTSNGGVVQAWRAEQPSDRVTVHICMDGTVDANSRVHSHAKMSSTVMVTSDTPYGNMNEPGWKVLWSEFDFDYGDTLAYGVGANGAAFHFYGKYGDYETTVDAVTRFSANTLDTNLDRLAIGGRGLGSTPTKTDMNAYRLGRFFIAGQCFNRAEREKLETWLRGDLHTRRASANVSPSISGVLTVGSDLTLDRGSYNAAGYEADLELKVQWYIDGVAYDAGGAGSNLILNAPSSGTYSANVFVRHNDEVVGFNTADYIVTSYLVGMDFEAPYNSQYLLFLEDI